MRIASVKWMLFGTMAVLLGWFFASPARLAAQTGDNAVYTTACCSPSASFIDASVFTGYNGETDICARINRVITGGSLPAPGGVIDARGINSSMTCPSGDTPWSYFSGGTHHNATRPSHILLPAGTIVISTPWVMPDRNRITGEGRGGPGGTTIQASNPGFTGSEMIQMGDNTGNTSLAPAHRQSVSPSRWKI
jgi:hypothetical protein